MSGAAAHGPKTQSLNVVFGQRGHKALLLMAQVICWKEGIVERRRMKKQHRLAWCVFFGVVVPRGVVSTRLPVVLAFFCEFRKGEEKGGLLELAPQKMEKWQETEEKCWGSLEEIA